MLFTLAIGGLCTLAIRLFPWLGSLLTDDEAATRYLASVGGAEVSPAWGVPIVFSLLLLIGLIGWKVQSGNRHAVTKPNNGTMPTNMPTNSKLPTHLSMPPEVTKLRMPLFFRLSLWLGFVPVFMLAFMQTKVNTVPVKVVFAFIKMFLQ